eukprot:g3772.t1
MSSKVTSADMEEFSKAFIIFDRDADGTVSMDELKLGLAALGRAPEDDALKKLVADAGGSDGLTHEQFQKFMSNMKEGTATEKEIMDALEVFDKDKNGTIDCKELKTAMMEMGDNPLSKEEAEELIRRGNPEATLGSSRIEYKPFVGIMMKAIPGAKVDD